MWYFTWILGIGVALGFGIINVLWLDANGKFFDAPGVEPPPLNDRANSAAQASGAQPNPVGDRRS